METEAHALASAAAISGGDAGEPLTATHFLSAFGGGVTFASLASVSSSLVSLSSPSQSLLAGSSVASSPDEVVGEEVDDVVGEVAGIGSGMTTAAGVSGGVRAAAFLSAAARASRLACRRA